MCLDRFGRWGKGHKLGTILRTSRDSVWIIWDHQPEVEVWSQGDARYEVDRQRWRITGPRKLSPMEAIAGVSKESLGPGAPKLTSPNSHGKIGISPQQRGATEGGKVVKEEVPGTLSAKQVATRIGIDAKTFRRFLRSSSCTIEPVGQGGRYEFGSGDIASLKKQFDAWKKPGTSTKPSSNGKKPISVEKPAKKKHHIDDDPPEVRFSSSIAERQRAAEMFNAMEDEEKEAEFWITSPDSDSDLEPTDEDLEELDLEQLEELDIEAALNVD